MPLGIRFAPSPTGTFHVGNLRTAWVSKQIASTLQEPWIIRVEDIDSARVSKQAWIKQATDLKTLGLEADSLVVQSERYARHLEKFEEARRNRRIYPCDCSRREVLDNLAHIARAPHDPVPEYSGRCRHRDDQNLLPPDLTQFHPADTLAWRWKSADSSGQHDAIVARTDAAGLAFTPGYHWACAIDDADGNYRVLVRAWDLAPADVIQKEIRSWVAGGSRDTEQPVVFHTSLVTRDDGGRLEKRTQGVTLDEVLARGFSSRELLDIFRKSFDALAAESAVRLRHSPAGETAKSISLSQLGL